MDHHLLDRLRVARAVLGGFDSSGRRVHPSMFDTDVVSLAHGDGTRRPHPSVITAGVDALLETERGSLDDYLFLQRHEEFDAAISADFECHGIAPETARNICVDSGTTRLFAAFLRVCSRPGDVFLVPRSYYHPLPSWCELHGIEPALVDTCVTASYKLTQSDVHDWFARNQDRASRTRGIFLFNPTQTGAMYTAEELKSLAVAVYEHDLVVLEDGVFGGTEFPAAPMARHLAASAPEIADQVVTLRGASKAFNLANIRIGWACGPARLIDRMNDHTVTTLATVPYIAKAMALAALRAPASYLLANATESALRAALITELVGECNRSLAEGTVLEIPHQPQAGHGLLVNAAGLLGRRLPDGTQVRSSIDITRYLLTAARVAVSPGYSLGFDGAELRLAFGSVGLKSTYPGTADRELAAALDGIAARCGRSCPATVDVMIETTEALRSAADETNPEIFQAGRDLIAQAFRERILPALSALLTETAATRPAPTQRALHRPGAAGSPAIPPSTGRDAHTLAALTNRSLGWDQQTVVAIDQTALPGQLRILRLTSVDEVIDAIRRLAIRGAPALGLAGALGVSLAAHVRTRGGQIDTLGVNADGERLAAARPTAVNLARGVRRALARLPGGPAAVLAEAQEMLVQDEQANRAAAARAAELVRDLCGTQPLRLLTHCNTGRLATAAWGTALGAIRELAGAGQVESVLATETRPLLQGARLTAWELAEDGIRYQLCVDSAAASAIADGLVDCVLVGADRIAANGDVANKIGTYPLALAAARHGVPFIVVAPESTLDEAVPDGDAITIEERPADEVTCYAGIRTAPPGAAAYNPAFDITPTDLITAVVTERRLLARRGPGGCRPEDEQESARALSALAHKLYRRGWMEGTGGNLSMRLASSPELGVITASGRSKGELTAADSVLIQVSTGHPVRPGTSPPSAETAIHAALYQAFPDCGAVVHAHSPYSTAVASAAARSGSGQVRFTDFEIIKGLGLPEASTVSVPVLANWPEVSQIAADLADRLGPAELGTPPVLLIAHHGATAWGPTLEIARNRLESLEALCQLYLLTNGHPALEVQPKGA